MEGMDHAVESEGVGERVPTASSPDRGVAAKVITRAGPPAQRSPLRKRFGVRSRRPRPDQVTCRMAGAESIALLAEKNPFPLMAHAELASGTEGYLNTRFKMGQTSVVKVVVKAGGKHYIASREIKVTIGGCGG